MPGTWAWDNYTQPVGSVGTNPFDATFTPTDGANYNNATISLTVTVGKATPACSQSGTLNATYGDLLSTVTPTGSCNVPGTWVWNDDTQPVGSVGPNSFDAIFTPTDGANYNNATISLTVTVSSAEITTAEITVNIPIMDGIPSPTVVAVSSNFTGTVVWSPSHNPFQGNVAYTATATLTADANYEFAANFANATINGENATISNNTGAAVTISYTFPQTSLITVTGIAIKSQPTNLTYTQGANLNLSGLEVTLTYSDATTEDIALADFTSKNITTNPVNGTTLSTSSHNNTRITVIYNNSPTIRISTNVLTVSKIEIANAEITVTPPAKDNVPSTTANGEGNFTIGTVTWNPSHSTFQGDIRYVATVTLTAKNDYAFTARTVATFNGEAAQATLGANGATLTLTYVFPKTLANLITLKIDGLTLDNPSDNKFTYVSPCGENSANININTQGTENATIIIDGETTNSQDVKLSYGNNKVSITAIASNSTQEYELNINKPFPADSMIKVRWNNTLTVINNARYNSYDFESYKWYRNGKEVGTGQSWSAGSSGEKLKPEDKYHVETITKDGETIRSCEVTITEEKQEYGILLKRNSGNSVEFEVITPEKSEIEIAVYDLAGNLVSKPTGNSIGNEIVSGLYFVVVKAKGESGKIYRYSTKLTVKK